MAKLKRKGPLTVNALAAQMAMDRSTLGRNVQPLERDGLITVETSAADRRAKVLRLTPVGEKRLEAALKAWLQAQVRFEANFGGKRAVEMRALMRTIVASSLAPAARLIEQ